MLPLNLSNMKIIIESMTKPLSHNIYISNDIKFGKLKARSDSHEAIP